MTATTEIAAVIEDSETSEPTEATIDGTPAVADRPLITLGDGRVVAPARDREVLLAWGIDALLVFLSTYGIYVILATTMPDPFSFARELNALAVWPVVALIYGFTTGHRRSLGQRIAGTRTLRIDTGAVPGVLRAGWMMVLRVMILPVVFLFCLCGGSTFGIKDRHVSIDALATGL
ncbi:hypothetical protein GCM10023063_18080 [Arthrobacter methylotrophus]|uniref:RDD family protein n=1 Tax=Arthrobacter methylotrophus TaxID=121291 RepID=A0ABV5UNW3_9MICC